jgi:tRNA (guanine37-N1)-methyltransferase
LTLFPEIFDSFLKTSIFGRAIKNEIVNCDILNIRDFSQNKHKRVDDYPYGGGRGMVMQVEPLALSLESIANFESSKVVYLSPKGKLLNQEMIKDFAKEESIILVCGHYEGIDQRFIDNFVDEEVSIGDYVLTGGEIPAMVFMDSVSRMIDGVLSDEECFIDESHYSGLLEYPHYTRPSEYRGYKVPDVLLSGNHKEIEKWRREKSLEITRDRRLDMIDKIEK